MKLSELCQNIRYQVFLINEMISLLLIYFSFFIDIIFIKVLLFYVVSTEFWKFNIKHFNKYQYFDIYI